MRKSITREIIESHYISGSMSAREEVAIRIDHTPTRDVTGTQAYLALETLDIPRAKKEYYLYWIM